MRDLRLAVVVIIFSIAGNISYDYFSGRAEMRSEMMQILRELRVKIDDIERMKSEVGSIRLRVQYIEREQREMQSSIGGDDE